MIDFINKTEIIKKYNRLLNKTRIHCLKLLADENINGCIAEIKDCTGKIDDEYKNHRPAEKWLLDSILNEIGIKTRLTIIYHILQDANRDDTPNMEALKYIIHLGT